MEFGLYGLHRGSNVDPEVLTRRAQAAEAAGVESLWVGDHITVPVGDGDDDRRLEAITALSYLAAVTERVRLAIGVIVLPQRQPLVLAKQLTTLDRLSGGRLTVGAGVGHLRPELEALGVAPAERAARMDEALELLRVTWADEVTSFTGRWTSYDELAQRPLPVQRPHPPLVLGGHAGAALARAARQGDGWFGWELTPEQVAETGAELARLRAQAGRADEPLEITVKPHRVPDRALVEQYAEVGVHRLVLQPQDSAGEEIEALVEVIAALRS
jgi:probable F420-dependent oxidoreductase